MANESGGSDTTDPRVRETQDNAAANAAAPAPPPPPPVAYDNPPRPVVPYAGSRGPARAPAPTAPSDPAQAAFDAIPQAYRNILEDLEHTWQMNGGYAAQVTKQHIVDMAKAHVVSAADFGKWMWANAGLADDVKNANPWLGVGLDQNQYVKATNAYLTQWMKLTGKQGDLKGLGTAAVATAGETPDARSFIWNALQNGSSPSDFSDVVAQDKNVRDTYKWLTHGIDYEQFQVKKQDMALAFGQQLGDDQAVLQLTYWSRFTDGFGENQAIHAQNQAAGGEQSQALQQGAVGVTGNTGR